MTEKQFESITKWQRETFPNANALSRVNHLAEEVLELHEALHKHHSASDTEMELADCFILLFGAANAYGMSYDDILNAIDKKMDINKARKWGKPDENGVVKHVKD